MFDFLKKKLGIVLDKFSKQVEEESVPVKASAEVQAQDRIPPLPEAPGEEESLKPEPAAIKSAPENEVRKKSIVESVADRITKTTLSADRFDKLFWEIEVALMENNVAVEVIDRIKADLREEIVGRQITRSQVEETVHKTLAHTIQSLFDVPGFDLLAEARNKKPFIIAFVGINGSGKTTTIAKVAKLLKDNHLSSVFAAADTFRAASQEQIEEHARRLGIRVVKHNYGADPAAVAFDAIQFAAAHKIDVVLIDTAGRLHSNTNLMDELKKVIRVAKPDAVLFVGESITGNDCVEQARNFNEAIGITGIILTKADVDDKGGAAVSVSYVTHKPILYLGVGQGYDDLEPFNARSLVQGLGLV